MTDHVTDHVTAGDMWSALDSSRDRSGSRSRGGAHGARCTERGPWVPPRDLVLEPLQCTEVRASACHTCNVLHAWLHAVSSVLQSSHILYTRLRECRNMDLKLLLIWDNGYMEYWASGRSGLGNTSDIWTHKASIRRRQRPEALRASGVFFLRKVPLQL